MSTPGQSHSKVATSSRRAPKRAAQLGVSDIEYARLLASQDGHCALCPNRPKSRRLHVDHDHMSKPPRVRGLLCHRCNRALPTWVTRAWLLRAAAYVDPPPRRVTLPAGLVTRPLATIGGELGQARAYHAARQDAP